MTSDGHRKPGWRRLLAALPGSGAAFLPAGICPVCWPAYAALLSSLGLGFLLNTAYLFLITAVFLGIALFSLAYRAGSRRGYRPFSVGVLAAAVILVSKFVLVSNVLVYGGVALLIAASVWNVRPRKAAARSSNSCSQCTAQEPAS